MTEASGPAVLALVGAGPRAVGLLERLAANAAGRSPRRLIVEVVDPFPPGAGRTWRRGQSPLLWMNSRAGDVTMFTDDTVECLGPLRPGPTLAEWAAGPGGRALDDPGLAAEARATTAESFASRRLAGEYLRWCFRRAVADLPGNVETVVRTAYAVSVDECGGRQRVALSTGDHVEADVVVLAQGNIDGRPGGPLAGYAGFARRHGGGYLPPGYPADVDTTVLPAGRDVIVSGLGLAFFDLMILLTEGRGGRFHRDDRGRLRYRPGGSEPVLWAGSRRGLPYRPKTTPRRYGGPCELPRFVTARSLRAALHAGADQPAHVVLGTVWGLVCKELAWGYYHELFHAHGGRTTLSWRVFAREFAGLAWWDTRMAELIAAAVPAAEDRLNVDLDQFSLGDRVFADGAALAGWLRTHLLRAVRRATSARHSAEAGAAHALLSVANQMLELRTTGPLPPGASVLGPLSRLLTFLGSGPPPARLEQLCALSDAGVVRFLGGDLTVTPDAGRGLFVARSAHAAPVEAALFVEARLPDADVASGDPLLARLVHDGHAATVGPDGARRLLVDGASYGIVAPGGRADRSRLAMGAFASGGALGSFSHPRTNAAFFRQNDATARWILDRLGLRHAVPVGAQR